ncbi:phage tail protein [Salmonella enterica]|nr:phage tail protein [Salmonella enterica]ELB8084892.1 phage tail protein [Salmonella enterica]ELJ1892605.1 phage tail protein [Salmonella enterica]
MFALLGDIEFEILTGPDALDASMGSSFAQQERIGAKPGLQFTGHNLDEYHLTLMWHQQYCDPWVQWQTLNAARLAHQALAFVTGAGDYLGYFVITDANPTWQLAGGNGQVQAMQVEVTLREFTGDPKNPLKPPALKNNLSGVSAIARPTLSASGIGGMVHEAVGLARQAQSAMASVSGVIRVASQLKRNPVVAFSRVPGMIAGLGGVTGPLEKAFPVLSGLTASLPESSRMVRAASDVITLTADATARLKGLQASNLAGLPAVFDNTAELAGRAASVFNDASPALSRMASRIMTRSL